MLTAIKEDVEVMPGGFFRLHSNILKPHTIVSVSAVVEIKEFSKTNLQEMIGQGKGIFKSSKDVDVFIRCERDNWEANHE